MRKTPERSLAARLFDAVPGPLRALMGPVVSCQRWMQQMRPEAWVLQGTEPHSQTGLAVLISAQKENRDYLGHLIFGANFEVKLVGRKRLADLLSANVTDVGNDCAIVLTEALATQAAAAMQPGSFFIPTWVKGEMDLPLDPEIVRKNHTVKNDLRKIQKNALHYEVTREATKFDEFYHQMHVPFIMKVHGDSAFITPYESMRSKLGQCELLLLKHQEQSIAGLLIIHEETGPRLWSVGVRDARPEYSQLGAMPALYHFSFEHLLAKGLKRVSLGASRAFLRDGVLQYKRKYGQRIASAFPDGFMLRVRTLTPAVRAFLANNPFIFRRGVELHGAAFSDADPAPSGQDVRQAQVDCLNPGLSRLHIYCLCGGAAAVETPAELKEQVVVENSPFATGC